MSSKRAANQELNHDNWNDEEKSEEVGIFKKASDAELQQRVRAVGGNSKQSSKTISNPEAVSDESKPSYPQNPTAVQQNAAPSLSGSQPDYQQNYYKNQGYTLNQQGQYDHDPFSQQNYSCFTPTINSTNAYITSDVSQAAQTTQSVNYSQSQEVEPANNGFITHHASAMDSPLRQPQSIPTYSAAVNAIATNSSDMHMTHSQQQVVSPQENKGMAQTMTTVNQVVTPVVSQQQAPVIQPPAAIVVTAVKSSNIDSTLMPINAVNPIEEPFMKALVPEPPTTSTEPSKTDVLEKPKALEPCVDP